MLRCCPITLAEANALVLRLHRHHKAAVGLRFAIGARRDGELVGAAIVGRPVARKTPQYDIAEVTRLVSDGSKNVCSLLYAACARAAAAIGYRSIQTFTLATEPGTSLRAAGWSAVGTSPGRDWNVPSRGGRRTDQAMGERVKWEKLLTSQAPQ